MRSCQILLQRCCLNEPKSRPNVVTTNEYEPTDVQIFAVLPIYLLPGNIISAVIGLVYINLQPKYELCSSTHLQTISEVWKNFSWEHCPTKNIFAWGSEILFIATCASHLTTYLH